MKQNKKYVINDTFPTPVYLTKRDTEFSSFEIDAIQQIIEEEGAEELGQETGRAAERGESTWLSNNSYIFNTHSALSDIKKFIDDHIDIYIREVISSERKIQPYITQSWIVLAQPSGIFYQHWHSNSVISGVFYINTENSDEIWFYDPNSKIKSLSPCNIQNQPSDITAYNAKVWKQKVVAGDLVLFPSWLEHSVGRQESTAETRLSLAFNVFAKGHFGEASGRSELILE